MSGSVPPPGVRSHGWPSDEVAPSWFEELGSDGRRRSVAHSRPITSVVPVGLFNQQFGVMSGGSASGRTGCRRAGSSCTASSIGSGSAAEVKVLIIVVDVRIGSPVAAWAGRRRLPSPSQSGHGPGELGPALVEGATAAGEPGRDRDEDPASGSEGLRSQLRSARRTPACRQEFRVRLEELEELRKLCGPLELGHVLDHERLWSDCPSPRRGSASTGRSSGSGHRSSRSRPTG